MSWRIFDEYRQPEKLELPNQVKPSTNSSSPISGLLDTQMTVAMLGLLNFIAGWPILFLAQWVGLDQFQWPPSVSCWRGLLVNGLVEYLFDASCAIAIYVTSPVTVAMVSPLTIPLAALVDHVLYNQKNSDSNLKEGGITALDGHPFSMLLGTAIILVGVYWIERPPKDVDARKKT